MRKTTATSRQSMCLPSPQNQASRHNENHPPRVRSPLQAGGHRFDPGWLHHFAEGRTPVSQEAGVLLFPEVQKPIQRLLEVLLTA